MINENKLSGKDCSMCKESLLNLGEKSEYGAVIIYKIGDKKENSWFATLSPKTGGDIEIDFSIQLIPSEHHKNFSSINTHHELAKNYGIAFAKISAAIAEIISSENFEDTKIPIGTYGKCKHEDEHIHIKLFPYRGDIGQPFTIDSSYEKKQIFKDNKEEFIKMKPVIKKQITNERFNELSNKLIQILK
jgi:hypothetical protein